MKYKQFETERLILKPTSEEDAEFILNLFNSPKWIEFIGDRNIKNIEEASEYIASKMISQLNRLGYSNYTVIRKTDGLKIGTCGLYDREGVEGIDIGFAFLPEFEGKGYAFESSDKLKELAFHEFGLQEISAITTKQNFASQRLLEKLGMSLVDTMTLPNDDEKLLLYKIKNQNQ